MKYFSFFLLCLCCACAAPQFKSVQVNTYKEEKKIGVNVSTVDLSSTVEQFDRLPHIEDEMPITPENALKKWVLNRFYASNPTSKVHLNVVIEKAYLTKTDDKMPQWYIFDNEKYMLTYALKFVFKKENQVLYTYYIEGYETSSLPKRSSISSKEAVFEKMLNAMIYKVDEEALDKLPKKFIMSDY